jgi:murein DD-endopeptidase MepM/ murein hydrolase activator NlpD
MARDDRFFSITVANANGLRSSIRSFRLHKRWVKFVATFVFVFTFTVCLGFYGLFQHANHLRIERENAELKAEKEKLKNELIESHQRLEAGEEKLQKLVEMSGVNGSSVMPNTEPVSTGGNGAGGPAIPVNSMEAANALKARTVEMELKIKAFEATLKEKVKIPSIWPLQGLLNDDFGGRRSPFGGGYEFHAGQDIKVDPGTPVAATAEGTVIFAGAQSGYGLLVVIEHSNGLSTHYGHLSEIKVKQGQTVKRGEIIALSGNTGRSTGPHLHYEVRINNEPVDPSMYLPNYDKMPRKE